MRIQSPSQHSFAQVPRAEIPRSSFDRSHGYKTTFDAGLLIPIFVDEALPGDTFNLAMTGFARMATPIFPVMDNLFMETFFFAVPHRLLWDNWQRFCGEQTDPGDSTDFVVPQAVMVDEVPWPEGSVADYFGIPIGIDSVYVNALPMRAYKLIWNEWFRDQNLQDSLTVDRDDGPDSYTGTTCLPVRRGKRHDYFTSCLPWPQKGDSVELPLGTSAPVTISSSGTGIPTFDVQATSNRAVFVGLGNTQLNLSGPNGDGSTPIEWNTPSLAGVADLTTATAATINQLRQAFQIQKLLERDARGGTRYTEIVRAHFGVVSPDARLQRPEYLGGGRTMVNVSPVAVTSDNESFEPTARVVGDLGAFATASLRGHGFVKSFTEHCVIIGLVCVRADLSYQQGLNRMWSRSTRYDYYWPALAMIGEQAVLNKEIYMQDDPADDAVFGYQERYAEYRYKPSQITGAFRSSAAASLDSWHLAQDFAALPVLGDTFIQENPPIDRVLAVTDEPHFIFDSYCQLRCARPMPMFGVPGLIDHF